MSGIGVSSIGSGVNEYQVIQKNLDSSRNNPDGIKFSDKLAEKVKNTTDAITVGKADNSGTKADAQAIERAKNSVNLGNVGGVGAVIDTYA